MKSDLKYAKCLSEVKSEDYEKVQTWDGKGAFTFKLHNCPISMVAVQEEKEIAGLLFGLDIEEVKSPSFLRILTGQKEEGSRVYWT